MSGQPLTLIAAADPEPRRIIRDIVENCGCQTIDAENEADCLEKLTTGQPHLVILYHAPPLLDALVVCARLRSAHHSQFGVLVVIEADRVDEAIAAGADDVVTPDLHPALLLHRVYHLLHAQAEARALTAVQENTVRLRAFFDHSPDAYLLLDENGIILDCNEAACAMNGYTRAELVGQDAAILNVPPTYDRRDYTDRLRREPSLHYETVRRRKDGTVFPVEVVASLIVVGARSYILGIDRDITERRRVEHSEREQRLLAEALRDAAVALTSTLQPEAVLDRILLEAARVVPHDASTIALIEGDFARIVRCRGFDDPQVEAEILKFRFPIHMAAHYVDMMRTRQPVMIDNVRELDGWQELPETAWIQSDISSPIIIRDEVIGFLHLDSAQPAAFSAEQAGRLKAFADLVAIAIQNARDARELEQRVAERTAELNRINEKLEAILHYSSDAIVVTDARGIIQRANTAFAQLFGFSSGDSSDRLVFAIADPAETAGLEQALGQALNSRQPTRIELLARRRDGTSIDVDMVISPLRQHEDEVVGAVCSIRDMTERKRTESELRKALERERELSELKSRFVSAVSHEFRTPLAIIMSSADLVKNYGARLTDDQKTERLNKIQVAVRDMTRLIEDALTVSSGTPSNHLEFNPTPLSLVNVCQKILDDMHRTLGRERARLEIRGDCHDVIMDGKLLTRILTHLLNNAAHFSSVDQLVTLRLICQPRQVVFQVQDVGIGIPPVDQKHIFEPFYRGTNTSSVSGAGLGLTIVHQAVELHGGTIEFESSVGQGTTFTVTIPNIVV